ncbi:hypothetical protein HOG98_03900 [bacterium]|jgi:hypothetical protein|nr:hypothetical protein [bacterium]
MNLRIQCASSSNFFRLTNKNVKSLTRQISSTKPSLTSTPYTDKEEKIVFDPKLTKKAFENTSSINLAREWAILRTMRIKPLHPIAKWMLKESNEPHGKPLQFVLKPWLNQFCVHGGRNEAIQAAKDHGYDTKMVIFDHSTEKIEKAFEARETFVAYRAFLKREETKYIATKGTGVAREAVYTNPHFKRHPEYKYAKKEFIKTARLAKKLDKIMFIDAEELAVNGAITKIGIELMRKYQGHIYITIQATQNDAIEQIEKFLEDLDKTGSQNTKYMKHPLPLNLKLVRDGYSKDRTNNPDKKFQTIDETHANYNKIQKFCSEHPRINAITCTHNPTSLKNAETLGDEQVGQLHGMSIVHGLSSKLDSITYLISNPSWKKQSEYIDRRIDEFGETEPRREIMVETEIIRRLSCLFHNKNPHQLNYPNVFF